jgi:uncharacterized protein
VTDNQLSQEERTSGMQKPTIEGATASGGDNGARSPEGGPLHPSAATPDVGSLALRAAGLHLFRDVLADEVGETLMGLLQALSVDEDRADARRLLSAYGRLFSLLAAEAETGQNPAGGDVWQNHLLERLLASDNPFSRRAERSPGGLGVALREAAGRDLRLLRDLFHLDGEAVVALLRLKLGGEASLVPWPRLDRAPSLADRPSPPAPTLKQRLASEEDWPSLVDDLANHFASSGAGLFGRYRAFRWTRRDGTGHLEGISHPDPTRLEELVEYEMERALLLQNTEQFVSGFPANNVLLYGDRGTGKSSTVKALLHRYGGLGLRMVEVPKAMLGDFHRILPLLRGRRERFVIFVDDLSFDEHEATYKELKALLEGSLEARPENVVLYATSNRRHLVLERFSDRTGGDDEIRTQDTHQEKLSLADRFGITLIFSAPGKDRYLAIVASLAAQRGMEIAEETLRLRAVQWAMHQGGFSGRTARQFVDHLAGELGMATGG